jgi:hypothetical protein
VQKTLAVLESARLDFHRCLKVEPWALMTSRWSRRRELGPEELATWQVGCRGWHHGSQGGKHFALNSLCMCRINSTVDSDPLAFVSCPILRRSERLQASPSHPRRRGRRIPPGVPRCCQEHTTYLQGTLGEEEDGGGLRNTPHSSF